MTKTEQQIECAGCQWDKQCITPPQMTKEEIEVKLEESRAPKEGQDKESSLIGGLMVSMMLSGKDREALVCPTFASVLKAGPELCQHIKEFMKGT